MEIRSTRPLLGTLVTIGVSGVDRALAETALARGFAAIERVHSLMSFHAADSDVSRLNRTPVGKRVAVAPETFEVLHLASALSSATGGTFDVTVAPALVASGALPSPKADSADPQARWRDVVLEPDGVHLQRSLWLDLGGIAKGYAVDLAAAMLALPANAQWSINAGGDLRIGGPAVRQVALDVPGHDRGRDGDKRPLVELADASLASSATAALLGRNPVVHYAGRDRTPVSAARFVTVIAQRCAIADALTKVVMVLGRDAASALAAFSATAYLYSPDDGWQTVGGARP